MQFFIDSLDGKVTAYNDLKYEKGELETALKDQKRMLIQTDDTLDKLNSFNLVSICNSVSSKNGEQEIKQNLRRVYEGIFLHEREKAALLADMTKMEESLKDTDLKIKREEKEHLKIRSIFNDLTEGLDYPGNLRIRNKNYRFYIANFSTDRVRVHNNPNKGRGQRIKDVNDRLAKENEEALMITNGGMYTPSFGAQGLLIENSKQITKLDTLKPNNNLNFYLAPNGVFYIDSAGFHLSSTDEYKISHWLPQKVPQFATQSGPMLITKGVKNGKFKKGSTNFYIRSGVGVINSKKIVFIISDDQVNFYDFSAVFQEIFGCSNALYLDGAISEMYINPKYEQLENGHKNYNPFGPVISVSKIKK